MRRVLRNAVFVWFDAKNYCTQKPIKENLRREHTLREKTDFYEVSNLKIAPFGGGDQLCLN